MESRTWLAVALCCFVWFAYFKWVMPPAPPPPSSVPSQSSATAPPTNNQQSASAPSASAQTTTSPAQAPYFNVAIPESPSLVVKTAKQQIAFSEVGGKIYEVGVLEYLDTIEKDGKPILVQSPQLSPYNLATLFSDDALKPFSNAKYQQKEIENGVTFVHKANDVRLEKEYRYGSNDYTMDVTYRFQFPKGNRKDWGSLAIPLGGINPKYDHNLPLESWEVVGLQNEKILRVHADALEKEAGLHQGNTSWLSFGNRYFASVAVNHSELNPDIVVTHSDKFSGAFLRYPIALKDGQEELVFKLTYFLGPKDYTDLSKIPGLRQLIDYGMFSALAYPLLELLRFFYRFVGNYGVAIILLTILVRVLFYPLSVKSVRSMKAMQKLQPQIAALKEKHKDDMQRFSQEQMALFKAHKVNPMGGCLPMLVQLPVFIALYAVLGNSLELFHAPFFGWIHDLSSKDPYYIYPILMGLAMLVQTKLTPTAGADPVQQKMMYLMPVVFTFIMLNLPSGLTIYIFVSTVLGILQQVMMKDPQSSNVVIAKSEGAPEKG